MRCGRRAAGGAAQFCSSTRHCRFARRVCGGRGQPAVSATRQHRTSGDRSTMRHSSRFLVPASECAMKSNKDSVTMMLLVFTAIVTVGFADERIVLRKCCPLHQRLDSLLRHCEDDPSASGTSSELPANSSAMETLVVPTAAAMERWVHAEMRYWDSETQTHGLQLIQALSNDSDARVQLGPEAPCEPSRRKFFTWNSHSRFRLLPNGQMLLRSETADEPNLELSPDEFCADTMQGNFVFITCPCTKVLCINKCCQLGMELKITTLRKKVAFECVRQTNKTLRWKPQFYEGDLNDTVSELDHVVLAPVRPVCGPKENPVMLNEKPGSTQSLWPLRNGSALLQGIGHGIPFPAGAWCGDMSDVAGHRVENAFVCHRVSVGKRNEPKAALYGGLFAVSSVFLALTLLVYALLPELRRSAHARALLCHVAALLAVSLTLASGQLRPAIPSMTECYVLGFVIQYSMLAAFFWLNVMCVEFARTFKELLPTHSSKSSERRKFMYYSVYAWGCPAIMSIVTGILEFTEGLPDYVVRADFGKRTCWMDTPAALFAYFYGPMAVLLLVNMVLYCFTAARLVRARRDTALARSGSRSNASSAIHDKRERLILHVKLFLLMGVTWAMECVSAAVGSSDAYWYATDVVNILRGVFVFVIFCCKRDVCQRLRARLRVCCAEGKSPGGAGIALKSTADMRGSAGSTTTRTSVVSLNDQQDGEGAVSSSTPVGFKTLNTAIVCSNGLSAVKQDEVKEKGELAIA